jgi:hypothetical protein
MSAEPDRPRRRFPFRDEAWGDEPQEVDAAEYVEELETTQPELARRWQDHPTFVPFRVVGRFIRRSGKRIAVTIVGGLLVLIGIVGLVLPIMPGWILIIPGLALLATEYVWAQRLLKVARDKAAQAKDMVLRRKRPEAESPEP